MNILYCSANMRKKFEMADTKGPPESQLKRHILVWATATHLMKWKVNLGNFSADSETETPFIDIKTFELSFQLNFSLNFKRFDVNFTFLMQRSQTKLKMTKTKHQEQVWNALEMHLLMTLRSLFMSRKMKILLNRQRGGWMCIILGSKTDEKCLK